MGPVVDANQHKKIMSYIEKGAWSCHWCWVSGDACTDAVHSMIAC